MLLRLRAFSQSPGRKNNMRVLSFGMARHATQVLAAAMLAAAVVQPAGASIIDEWSSVQVPPAPKIDPQTVDTKTTALLVLDFTNQICSDRTPRCVASLPKVASLVVAARKAGALVVYSRTPGATAADTDIRPEVGRQPGDPVVASGPDKYIGTNLAQILKDKGITTIIVTGVAANGAVLYTASDAALNGMNVVIPVDGMSAGNAFAELYVAYNMTNAPGMAQKVKLATTDGITFK
jgi:nicotinamidase-related amidase